MDDSTAFNNPAEAIAAGFKFHRRAPIYDSKGKVVGAFESYRKGELACNFEVSPIERELARR